METVALENRISGGDGGDTCSYFFRAFSAQARVNLVYSARISKSSIILTISKNSRSAVKKAFLEIYQHSRSRGREVDSDCQMSRDIFLWHPLMYRLPYTPWVPQVYLRRLGCNIEAVMGLSTWHLCFKMSMCLEAHCGLGSHTNRLSSDEYKHIYCGLFTPESALDYSGT